MMLKQREYRQVQSSHFKKICSSTIKKVPSPCLHRHKSVEGSLFVIKRYKTDPSKRLVYLIKFYIALLNNLYDILYRHQVVTDEKTCEKIDRFTLYLFLNKIVEQMRV